MAAQAEEWRVRARRLDYPFDIVRLASKLAQSSTASTEYVIERILFAWTSVPFENRYASLGLGDAAYLQLKELFPSTTPAEREAAIHAGSILGRREGA